MAEQGTHKPLVGSSNLPVATESILRDTGGSLTLVGLTCPKSVYPPHPARWGFSFTNAVPAWEVQHWWIPNRFFQFQDTEGNIIEVSRMG
jgi:hypothetical protein